MRGRLTLWGTMVLASQALPVCAEPPVVAIARIGSEIDDETIVGSRRAGMICAPNGSIRWSEVSGGTGMDQREVVQDVLEDAGIAVLPLGETSAPTRGRTLYRVRGVIRTAAFKLCARHYGLGDAKALSGEAALSIEWRAEERADPDHPIKHLTTITRTIAPAQAQSLGGLYRTLLKAAAADLAHWLEAPDVPPAPASPALPSASR